jgi:hypothetical protein
MNFVFILKLNYYHYSYETFKLIIVGLAPGMFTVGIMFLISSVLLSGKTRRTLFWGASRHICARVLNSIVFTLCYILLIIWFIITCSLMYPLFLNAYYKFLDCKTSTNQVLTNSNTATPITPPLTLALVNDGVTMTENCIDARLLRLHSGVGVNGTKICDEKKHQLCVHVKNEIYFIFERYLNY